MNDYVLLDILLGLIVALFAAIGFWRGAAKEVVVTAGIFAGWALALSWAAPWGSDLANLVELRADVAQLVVAAIALFSATVVLGYGGSALIGTVDVGWSGRLMGAALAAINGGLLLRYSLTFIERFLTDEGAQRALDRSEVARILLRQFGWLLVGAASVMAICIVVGLLVNRRRAFTPLVPAAVMVEPATYHDPAGRQRPARLPREADAGKYEPVTRGYDPTRERFDADAPSVNQTIPLPPVDPVGLAYGGGRGTPPADTSRSEERHRAPGTDAFSGDEWYRRAQGLTRPGTPAPAEERSSANGQFPPERNSTPSAADTSGDARSALPESGANGHASVDDGSAFSWIQRSSHPGRTADAASARSPGPSDQPGRRCRVCDAELSDEDGFCPRCGTQTR
jgi:uncharacterized membrane protein required for colicin V production